MHPGGVSPDRQCLDVTQQLDAVVSGAREVTARILGDHLQHCLSDPKHCDDGGIEVVVAVLRRMIKA